MEKNYLSDRYIKATGRKILPRENGLFFSSHCMCRRNGLLSTKLNILFDKANETNESKRIRNFNVSYGKCISNLKI